MASASSSSANPAKRSLLQDASDEKIKKVQRKTRNEDLTPEQQAVQALKDNFPGFSSEDLYSKRIDGKTCYDHVLEGKQANTGESKAFKMGRKFYQNLRKRYKGGDDPEQELAEIKVDETQVVRPRLFKAMVQAMKTVPNRSSLLELLEVEEAPNHKELVGILKWTLQQTPSVSPEQLRAGLTVMGYIARHNLQSTYAKEVGICRKHFDEILSQARTVIDYFFI